MNPKNLLPFVLFWFICSFITSNAQIKVACVGNSITYGAGIENREQNSYPAQLGKLLGTDWQVNNFGVSGSTLLKNGDRPCFHHCNTLKIIIDYLVLLFVHI